MRLRAGVSKYRIPRYSEIYGVLLLQRGFFVRLKQVPWNELPASDVRAIPSMYAVLGRYIAFWPAPHKRCEARVRYTPPVEEY